MSTNFIMALGPIFFVAIAVALAICLAAIPIGTYLGIMAHPDLYRKRHGCPTPQVGGMAILLALTVWLVGSYCFGEMPADRPLLLAILLSAMGVGLIGFEDDQNETSPLSRILLLLVFMGSAFVINPQFIAHTLNWASFGPVTIPLWGYLMLMSTTVVGLVNAVNMADGQNGVVGSMFLVWSGCLMIVTHGASAEIASMVFLTSLVFLIFNLYGKVFLGDCGSYGVTFVIGLLVTLAHARRQLPLEVVIVWFFIPVVDCLRLLVSRPLRGLSPFVGDRDHFHHRLEGKLGRRQGFIVYAGAVATSSAIATLDPRYALVCLCVLCAFYFSFAWLTDPAVIVEPYAAQEQDEMFEGADNIVSIDDGNMEKHKRQSGR